MGRQGNRDSRPSWRYALCLVPIATLLLTSCTERAPPRSAPERASGFQPKPLVRTERTMVVAAHPLAADAGREMLQAGGTAVDAAIATQLVLGLVEPQSSGLGGGAVMLHWDARTRGLTSYDGRETAPSGATPDRFLRNGRPMPFDEAVRSGLSVGVPGVVRLIEEVHRLYGRLPWPALFGPARRLAEEGFAISPRLHALLAAEAPERFAPAARSYFFDPRGQPWPVGHNVRNTEYAQTLGRIASEGQSAFYAGPVAAAIVEAVRTAPRPGDLSLDDLSSYRAVERPPVCAPYRWLSVCGMGPPSSGGIAVGQSLMLLDGFDLGRGQSEAGNFAALHLIGEALKLAFADRNWYVADPDHVAQPVGMLDPVYIAERRRLISPVRIKSKPHAGTPPGSGSTRAGLDATREVAGTSHISIVDAEGNAVSMTTTIESGFGSHLWAAGFLLNNQLTDFSFRPRDGSGRLVANRIGPGKRPRSSMSPTIVLDRAGSPVIVTGSPGGSRIIPYVVKALVAQIDWHLDPAAAAALPNLATQGDSLVIEEPGRSIAEALRRRSEWLASLERATALKALGQAVRLEPMTSGLHTIVRLPDGRLEGGADPRREGVAVGD